MDHLPFAFKLMPAHHKLHDHVRWSSMSSCMLCTGLFCIECIPIFILFYKLVCTCKIKSSEKQTALMHVCYMCLYAACAPCCQELQKSKQLVWKVLGEWNRTSPHPHPQLHLHHLIHTMYTNLVALTWLCGAWDSKFQYICNRCTA